MRKRPAAPYRLAKITSGPFHLVYKEKNQRHPTAWQKLRADPSTSHIKEKKATSYKKKGSNTVLVRIIEMNEEKKVNCAGLQLWLWLWLWLWLQLRMVVMVHMLMLPYIFFAAY